MTYVYDDVTYVYDASDTNSVVLTYARTAFGFHPEVAARILLVTRHSLVRE